MQEDEDLREEEDSDASAAGMILDGLIDEETGEWTDEAFEGLDEDEDEDDGEF